MATRISGTRDISFKPIWILKFILYAIGVYCFFYSQNQYEITLIGGQKIVLIGLVSGLIATLIIERDLRYYLISIALLGSICTAIFFKLNDGLAHSAETTSKHQILNKVLASHNSERSKITVEWDGLIKDVPIESEDQQMIVPSKFVTLTVKKGALGYYIITDKELQRE